MHRNRRQAGEELPGNQRTNDEGNENDEHDKVEDGEADDSSLAKLRLLQRIDRGTNLSTMEILVQRRLVWNGGS